MMHRRKLPTMMLTIISMASALLLTGSHAYAQSASQFLDWLSPQNLSDLGVRLPDYMATIADQMSYQAKSPMHQEVVVQWNANATDGKTGFSLLKRWQHISKTAKVSTLNLQEESILVIAATPGGEVRGLTLQADTRATSHQVDVELPQDGQINRVIFVAVNGRDLQLIGEASLGLPDGVVHASK